MARKLYNVTLARRADRMLVVHAEFLARVSPAATKRLVSDFRSAAKLLAENPFQHPYADEIDAPGIPIETYRKCLFGERYKALYLVDGTDVFVDAVIDCRQENADLY